LAARCHELVSFLVDVRGLSAVQSDFKGRLTYHDSCSGLRELNVKRQPRQLLLTIPGVDLVELAEPETCCGFGGTFCVKYPAVSTRMVENKTKDITATGADTLAAGDVGCLLNMAGKLKREGSKVRAYHVAEILAGTGTTPAIAEPGRG
jgi:L-lactate dehydrogenase complex protein LldE